MMFSGSQVPRFPGSQVPRFPGSQVPRFSGSQVPGFSGSRGSEVRKKVAQRVVAFAGDVNPVQVRLFAEPDQLTARVLAVLEDDQFACGGFIADAVQMLQRLPVDEA